MIAGQAGKHFNVVTELLGDSPVTRADKVAIRCGEGRTTYRELAENINRFANLLRRMGIKPTDRVMIVLPDTPIYFYAFLGSIVAGAWPVPVNIMLGEGDYRYLLEDSEARLLVTTPEHPAARVPTAGLEHMLLVDHAFPGHLASFSPETEVHDAAPDDIAFWLYSSGSTGKPKGTPHKHASMLFTADTYARQVLGLTENDVCFSVSKLFFAYGLGNNLAFPLRVGATAVLLPEPPTPEKVLETLETHRPSVFYGVPTQYNSVLKKINGQDLSFLRICTSAGEALPPEIFRQWKARTGIGILDGIGSTEALHIFISNRIDDVREGTSGRLVPGYEARIVDDEGVEVSEGETGHLLIRGTSLTPGYWNRPEDNRMKVLPDGWFRTGDMYSRDDGFFVYQGRGDDMLKVGGIWVSPIEIEHAMLEHPAVNECAVVGAKVEGLVKPFAYVALTEIGVAMTERLNKDLLEFVAGKLPKFKRPWAIHVVDTLPKTATGKVQRFKLRQVD